MASISRACPLCGTLLSEAKFARVVQTHRGMQEQLARLKAAEDRAKVQLREARERARDATARAKGKHHVTWRWNGARLLIGSRSIRTQHGR